MPREYSGSAHSMGRSARRRGPGAISLRGGTQLRRLARRIQESGNQGEVAADAIYRKWKGVLVPLRPSGDGFGGIPNGSGRTRRPILHRPTLSGEVPFASAFRAAI